MKIKKKPTKVDLTQPFTVYGDARAIQGQELILNLGDDQSIGLIRLMFNKGHRAWDLYCKQLKITIEIQDPPITEFPKG